MIHKKNIKNFDFVKIKNICSLKDIIKRMRSQAKDWGKISAKHLSDKGVVSKIYQKELKTQQ